MLHIITILFFSDHHTPHWKETLMLPTHHMVPQMLQNSPVSLYNPQQKVYLESQQQQKFLKTHRQPNFNDTLFNKPSNFTSQNHEIPTNLFKLPPFFVNKQSTSTKYSQNVTPILKQSKHPDLTCGPNPKLSSSLHSLKATARSSLV